MALRGVLMPHLRSMRAQQRVLRGALNVSSDLHCELLVPAARSKLIALQRR
jgi:hypothetical protein